jgi:hypothetical protein
MRLTLDNQENVLSRLLQLTRSAYGGAEISEERYLRWLYLDNPVGLPEIYVNEDEVGLTAQFVLSPRQFIFEGDQVSGLLSLNTITRPDCRGRGLFTGLGEEALAGLSGKQHRFVLGFPNRSSARAFTGRLAFLTLGHLPFLIRPLRWGPLLRSFVLRRHQRKGADVGFSVSPTSVFRGKTWAAGAISFSDPRLKDLLEAVQRKRICATLRSAEYLSWRYADCPTRNYTLLAVWDPSGEQLFAYAVVRGVELRGLKCGVVVDIGCREETSGSEALGFLLNVILRLFKRERLDLAVAACSPGHQEYEGLTDAGLIRVPEKIHPQPLQFILRDLQADAGTSPYQRFENWFLTFGDYDVL